MRLLRKKSDTPTGPESSAELEQQEAQAVEALSGAQTAVTGAQRAYDADPSDETDQAVEAAEGVARRAERHLESVRRRLAAARQREAEEVRQRKRARLKQIRGLVCHAAVRESTADLVTRRVDSLVAYVDATVAAQEGRLALEQLAREGEALRVELGDPARIEDSSGLADNAVLVAEEIRRYIATLAGSDPRRRLLHDVAHWLHPAPHTGWRS